MLAERLGDGEEDDPGLLQLLTEGGRDGDAVEHGIDGYLARAFHAGEDLLLLDRNAELLVGAADLRIELIERFQLRLLLRLRVIISVLIIDRRDIQFRPIRRGHRLPLAERFQPPVEHPLRLALARGNVAHRVFGETLGREFLLDIGGEAPFVGRRAVDCFLGFTIANLTHATLPSALLARLARVTP